MAVNLMKHSWISLFIAHLFATSGGMETPAFALNKACSKDPTVPDDDRGSDNVGQRPSAAVSIVQPGKRSI